MKQQPQNPVLSAYFEYNEYVLKENLQKISHEESLVKPMDKLNSINWILGHILVQKDVILEELGKPKRCTEEIYSIYTEGNTLEDPQDALRLEDLIEQINRSEEIIKKELFRTKIEKLEKAKSIAGLAFHEAYNAGQIGIIRQYLGKENHSK